MSGLICEPCYGTIGEGNYYIREDYEQYTILIEPIELHSGILTHGL